MFAVRRVSGESMLPALKPGQIVVFLCRPRRLATGDVVLLNHRELEKVKRLIHIDGQKVYVEGDNPNPAASTDSRQFGWIERNLVQGKMIWPIQTQTTRKKFRE